MADDKVRYLRQEKSGLWTLRVQIPAELRTHMGRREFKKSLGHCSRSEAEKKSFPILSKWQASIERARQTVNGLSVTATNSHHIDAADRDEAFRESYTSVPDAKDEPPSQFFLDQELDMTKEAALVAVDRAKGINTKLNFAPDDWKIQKQALKDQLEVGYSSGQIVNTLDHLADYRKDALSELADKSADQMISAIEKQFAKEFPFIHEATISEAKVQRWLNSFGTQPNPPARKTLTRYKDAASGYFDWLRGTGRTSVANPFDKAKLPRASKKSVTKKREAFTDSELATLYKAMVKKGPKRKVLTQVFLIACYTGCRIEELFQLKPEDIHEHDDRLFIKVSKSKTDAGIGRQVPVHRKIERIIRHLLDNPTEGYLLGDASDTKYDVRSGKVGKQFGRLKANLDFPENQVFHSTRRSFISKLEALGVAEAVTADIVGHEKGTMTYGVYSSGTPLPTRFDAVDSVTYPQLEKAISERP